MSARELPIDPGFRVPGQRPSVRRGLAYLLIGLTILAAACQSTPKATQQWTPPYLEMHLYAGKAKVQWSEESEWTAMEGKSSVAISERGRIISDATEGAKLFLGDGSTLELAPETTVELRNPRTFPRLQVIVQEGSLLFFAQKPSYEFVTNACPVTLLSVPSLIRIEVNGETTHLAVEEGAVTCEMDTKTLTIPTCREISLVAGEEPVITEFCAPSTIVPPPTPTLSPNQTPSGLEPGATPSPTSSPTPTPTRGTPRPTFIPMTPTDTPTPPPPTQPPAKKPPATQPPPQPTEPPRPTQPPTQPTEPPPQPTQPPPQPTEARPTPAPPTASRGTPAPPSEPEPTAPSS